MSPSSLPERPGGRKEKHSHPLKKGTGDKRNTSLLKDAHPTLAPLLHEGSPGTRRLRERDLAANGVERATVDKGAGSDVEECASDAAVAVLSRDKDARDTKRRRV